MQRAYAYTDMSDEELCRLLDAEHARWPDTRWVVLEAVHRVIAGRHRMAETALKGEG